MVQRCPLRYLEELDVTPRNPWFCFWEEAAPEFVRECNPLKSEAPEASVLWKCPGILLVEVFLADSWPAEISDEEPLILSGLLDIFGFYSGCPGLPSAYILIPGDMLVL